MNDTKFHMPQTMLEAHVHADTSVTLHSVPIPKLQQPNDVLVRVICASCNPKDWKMPAGLLKTIADCPNSGDDLSGIVEEVGSAVTTCEPGDRVAALHELGAPHGAYAEFALVKDFACFRLPIESRLGWEQAATLPMAIYMASIALFGCLKLSAGISEKVRSRKPVLIYGASSGVGSMAVKLAQITNIHPLICVAGSGCDFAQGLIDKSKGDVVLDYREGDDAFVGGVQSVLGGQSLDYALDAISEEASIASVVKVLSRDGGRIALTLPGRAHYLPAGLIVTHVMAGSLWKKLEGRNKNESLGNLGLENNGPEFARSITDSIEIMLDEGELQPHPHVLCEGGLRGLEAALKMLREGKAGASRFVIRVVDTAI